MITEAELQQLEENQRLANPHPARCQCILCRELQSELERRAKGRARAETKLEAEIERDCTNILIQDGWRPLRTDPVSDRKRGKGFGELGMADHLYIRYSGFVIGFDYYEAMRKILPSLTDMHALSQVIWVEWKRRKENGADTKLMDHQEAWHDIERKRGALTLKAGVDFPATVEGFHDWYRNSGLKRGI